MAEIRANKKSVSDYLKSGAQSKFLIPDYQRPYSWTVDEISALWDDILTSYEEDKNSDFFCGTVVTFKNADNENEIIDGQQRTTSLLLLLRAIYTTLEQSETGLKNDIEKCLWEVNRTSGEPNKDNCLITSKVATDEHNEEFINILKTGNANTKDNNYAKNYGLFVEKVKDRTTENPTGWADLCGYILDKIILFPIECEDQNTALRIFSTLNDRGMSLSDADIFKAKIYNHLSDKNLRDKFIEQWKELEEETKSSGIEIQDLFYYYMWTLRARERRDISTTTPALRKYFARDKFAKLYDKNTILEIEKLSDLWKIIYNREELEDYDFSKSIEIKKMFDILKQYSNEYWKYVVSTYFLSHYKKDNFRDIFLRFLQKLTAYIVARLSINPTLNAVKTDFLYLNRDAESDECPDFYKEFSEEDKINLENSLLKEIRMYHKATRPLLYMIAYNNNSQTDLLPDRIEVEHILPRKWTNTNLFGVNRKDVESQIESLGNKILLEKKTNIQAGNKSFHEKCERYYKGSKIAVVNELSKFPCDNFTPDDIQNRKVELKNELMDIFGKWYLFDKKKEKEEPLSEPTDE